MLFSLRKHSAKTVSSGFYKWKHAIDRQFCVWYRQYICEISSRNIYYKICDSLCCMVALKLFLLSMLVTIYVYFMTNCCKGFSHIAYTDCTLLLIE